MKDTLNKPIEFICATYSTEGLEKLLPTLKETCNIAAVFDELTMRLSSGIEVDVDWLDEKMKEDEWVWRKDNK